MVKEIHSKKVSENEPKTKYTLNSEPKALTGVKFFIEVCNLTYPFDHIQTSEVCKTPYIPPGL